MPQSHSGSNTVERLKRTNRWDAARFAGFVRYGLMFLIVIQSYLMPLLLSNFASDREAFGQILYVGTILSYSAILIGLVALENQGYGVFGDRVSLSLIVLSCLLRPTLGVRNEPAYVAAMAFLGVLFLVYAYRKRGSLRVPSGRLVGLSLVLAAGITLGSSVLRVVLDPRSSTAPEDVMGFVLGTAVYDFAFVVVVEEAFFRGLLLGLLTASGVSENRALVIQGLLFWGTHYLKFGDGILFFVLVPAVTVCLSLVIRRWRMLFLTIMIHLVNNALGGLATTWFSGSG